MESRDYKGGFEDFLQEKTDQYKLYPSDKVWNAIHAELHPRKKWSYLFVAAIFLGLGIGGKLFDSSLVKEPTVTEIQPFDDQSIAAEKTPVVSINRKTAASHFEEATARQNARILPFQQKVQNTEVSAAPVNDLSALVVKDEFTATRVNDQISVPMISDQISAPLINDPLTATQTPGSAYTTPSAINSQIIHSATGINSMATIGKENLNIELKDPEFAKVAAPTKASSIKVLKPKHLNIGWQLYASPTVSYRKLSGEGMSYYNNNSMNSVFTADVEKSVRHKPAIGFELGTALTYSTGPNFRFKTGLQLNINRYEVQAFSYVPEVAPLTQGGIGHTTINAISTYRNYNGFSKTWLKNKHIMMSIPLGAEVTLFGDDKVKFNIGGTLQPTFVLNNQAYMISTNMKNYAQEPSLYKKFNVAAGAEAYVSIKAGSYRWMIGPQFRYQIFSSYKKEYPITEHLTDYGFKVGISR